MSNFGRLLGYLKPYRNRVAIAVGLMILVTLSTLPMPQITRRMIDVILPRKQWSALNTVFWIAIAVVPLYVGNFKFFLRKIRPLSVTLREKWDALLGTLQEKLAGISVVKAFVREDHETDNFMKKVQDNFDLGMQQSKLNRTL